MQVRYDSTVDAAFIELSTDRPQGGVEVREGIILHTTENDKLVAIEILDASKRFPIDNLFTLSVAP